MVEKDLNKLSRVELLELVLQLKENEKVLEGQNKKLAEQLMKMSEYMTLHRLAMEMDGALSEAVLNMDSKYFAFKDAAAQYRMMLEGLSPDASKKK